MPDFDCQDSDPYNDVMYIFNSRDILRITACAKTQKEQKNNNGSLIKHLVL